MSDKKYILAFDQNVNRTGWCLYQPHNVEAMLLGDFTSAPKEDMNTRAKTVVFGQTLIALLKEHKPDFVVWERAAEDIRRHAPKKGEGGEPAPNIPLSVNASQLILQQFNGQLEQQCLSDGIPFLDAHTKSWRAAILKNGNLKGPEAKREAKRVCQYLRIDAKNHDQAEAACLALYAARHDDYKLALAGLWEPWPTSVTLPRGVRL